MATTYTNIPSEKSASSSDQTVQVFNNYYQLPVSINNNELIAMTGFFENRGFGSSAAESTAITILTQASRDGYNGMQIMDTLKTLGTTEISGLVAEILNYNRLNTSLLGTAQSFLPSDEVARNIIA
jgi:hypothetical protein